MSKVFRVIKNFILKFLRLSQSSSDLISEFVIHFKSFSYFMFRISQNISEVFKLDVKVSARFLEIFRFIFKRFWGFLRFFLIWYSKLSNLIMYIRGVNLKAEIICPTNRTLPQWKKNLNFISLSHRKFQVS